MAKANLAMTAKDHLGIGSTPPIELVKNPGMTRAEVMAARGELLGFLRKQVKEVREVHALVKAGKGGEMDGRLLKLIRDSYLLPNIKYLKEVGLLPEEFKDVDFEQELAI